MFAEGASKALSSDHHTADATLNRAAVARAVSTFAPSAPTHWSIGAIPANQTCKRKFAPSEGWVWLQRKTRGLRKDLWRLPDALELLAGTKWWIPTRLCDSGIFLAETSEEAPPPSLVSRWLRNYRSQGILQSLSGMLLARSMKYMHEMTQELYFAVRRICEFGRTRFPVVTNMDFGPTSPQMVIPMGCSAVIDPAARTAAIIPVTG
jgi:hypothetical protein